MLLLLLPQMVNDYLVALPFWASVAVGIALLAFAADTYVIGKRIPKSVGRADIIFAADVAWVLLTTPIIWLFVDEFTRAGLLAMIDINVIVAMFALVEWLGIKQLRHRSANG